MKYNPEKCNCLYEEYGKQVCYGTKERDVCIFNGDKTKCNFYQGVIDATKKENAFLAETTQTETIVTADLYNKILIDIFDMDYIDIIEIFDIEEYSNVKTKDGAIVDIICKYTPKEVVDIYETYTGQFVVNKNDVLEEVSDDQNQFLVTKIDGCLIHLIAKDGYTTITYDSCLRDNDYKRIKQNVSIHDFFSEEVKI